MTVVGAGGEFQTATDPLFVEIRRGERRQQDFLQRLGALESHISARGGRVDRVLSGVKGLYLRIDVSHLPVSAKTLLAAGLKAERLVGKVFTGTTAHREIKHLSRLAVADSVAATSEAKLRGWREKRWDFKPDLKGKNTGRIVVKYVEAESATLTGKAQAITRMASLHSEIGAKVAKRMELSIGLIDVVELPEGSDLAAALNRYLAEESVEYAEPDHIYSLMATPNDTHYGSLWGMPAISAEAAWDIRTSASSVIVAIADTGIDYNHPDLSGNLWQSGGNYGYNAVSSNYVTMDDNAGYGWLYNVPLSMWQYTLIEPYHGTHVAGIVGAVGNNATGVTGVAWTASLMTIKIFSGGGFTSDAIIADGLDFALNNGARIVNASWGGVSSSQTVYDAIDALRDNDIVFVNAAGNSGNDNDSSATYPGEYGFPTMIVVGASDSSDQPGWPAHPIYSNDFPAGYSNYGRWSVDVFAPGAEIYSTQKSSRYQNLSGTSMAAPHVTGIIALAAAEFPDETAEELVDRVRMSADSVAGLASYSQSGGRANAEAALGARPNFFQMGTRCQVNTGDGIAIAGIVITGTSSKRVAFCGLGPALSPYLSGTLANPQITIYSGGTPIGSNDDWGSLSLSDRNELTSFGIAPGYSAESAWIGTLSPGAYSIHMSGVSGGTGIGMIQSWDIDGSTANRLHNISTRCYVGTGDQIAIVGFAITGSQPRQVYIRTLGPTLTGYGVSGALADTEIALYGSSGLIVSNDDWRSFDGSSTALETRLTEMGYQPMDNYESTIVRRLTPGNYTVHVTGKSATTGIALIEINEY